VLSRAVARGKGEGIMSIPRDPLAFGEGGEEKAVLLPACAPRGKKGGKEKGG